MSLSLPAQTMAKQATQATCGRPADVSDAAYLIAHKHPGGVRVLAERMGVSANTLQNKLNPNNTTHHLTLRGSLWRCR